MTNPTINVNLSSLAVGTVPTVTDAVNVAEGGNVDVAVTWPSNGANTITVDLNFSASGNQDPFNDVEGGDTSFQLTRNAGAQSATQTLPVENNASTTSDSYELTLTIGGVQYSTDPLIIVGGD